MHYFAIEIRNLGFSF